MSFEFLLAKNDKGIQRLRLLYLKLYFSDEITPDLNEVKEDRQDLILIECIKNIMKIRETFRNSIEVWRIPNEYKERISIGTKNKFEHIIIASKTPNEPDPIILNVSHFHQQINTKSYSKPKKTAFTGYWDPPNRASITLPPDYCDDI